MVKRRSLLTYATGTRKELESYSRRLSFGSRESNSGESADKGFSTGLMFFLECAMVPLAAWVAPDNIESYVVVPLVMDIIFRTLPSLITNDKFRDLGNRPGMIGFYRES